MEFRLVYKGPLPTASRSNSRTSVKYRIRREIHRQLKELWRVHPALKWQTARGVQVQKVSSDMAGGLYVGQEVWRIGGSYDPAAPTWVEYVANQYVRNGYRFVPMVRKDYGSTCSLAVLFLRRDAPGALIGHGGDLDNRLKVLLDGLRMPENESEIGNEKPGVDEDPFYCLLEDDALITDVSITTDRLLIPTQSDENGSDVELVIHVKTSITDPLAPLADYNFP